jgi:hypothetical protein
MGADHLGSPFWSGEQRPGGPEVAAGAHLNDHKRAMGGGAAARPEVIEKRSQLT